MVNKMNSEIEMSQPQENNNAMISNVIDDGLIAVGTGFMGMVAMGSALLLSTVDSLNPILQMIGLMLGIVATCLTLVTLILNLHERWKKSTHSRHSSRRTPGSK
jgi:hypothetical protein